MDIGELNERWLLRDKENVFLEQEEVALHSLQVGFDARVAITARISPFGEKLGNEGAVYMVTYLWKLPAPMIFFFDNARKTPETTS